MIRRLANTHKVYVSTISTIKTIKHGKIMKLKSPSKYLKTLQKKTYQQSYHVTTATRVFLQNCRKFKEKQYRTESNKFCIFLESAKILFVFEKYKLKT